MTHTKNGIENYLNQAGSKTALLKWLNEYIGVLEEAIEKDIDFLDSDNYETYKEAIQTFNTISDKPYKPVYYMRLIQEKQNELPF